ncbi:MAG TPA: PCP reductase family protein [Nitrospiria bacterium]|nr:PCP reductase family protein [Nitrospiria bacterium]
MKFICMKCNDFMEYEDQEKVADQRLGLVFSCKKCNVSFAMVTNPGETQLVHALGIQIGGRSQPAEPLELTRESLKEDVTSIGPFWTEEAEKRLLNVPSFVRTMARKGIEDYAKQKGLRNIDGKIMDEYREKVGM